MTYPQGKEVENAKDTLIFAAMTARIPIDITVPACRNKRKKYCRKRQATATCVVLVDAALLAVSNSTAGAKRMSYRVFCGIDGQKTLSSPSSLLLRWPPLMHDQGSQREKV
jgi:hypothetical protein